MGSDDLKIIKLAYFDEDSAIDFLESVNEGQLTQKISKSVEKYTDIGAGGNISKGFFNLLQLGVNGGIGRKSNSLMESELTRTVLTSFIEYAKKEENTVFHEKKMKLFIAKDSLAYFRNVSPYLKVFKSLDQWNEDESIKSLNHLELDTVLDNANGYYELIGTNESGINHIIRFNIKALKNNYNLNDLGNMTLTVFGIEVGQTSDSNLSFEHKMNTILQQEENKDSSTGYSFDEEEEFLLKDNELPVKDTHSEIKIIDAILAGVEK